MEVYQHQVGGHSRLIKLQHSALVFKPYTETEFTFYERLRTEGLGHPEAQALYTLKQFLPKYFGVNRVRIHQELPIVPSDRTPRFCLESCDDANGFFKNMHFPSTCGAKAKVETCHEKNLKDFISLKHDESSPRSFLTSVKHSSSSCHATASVLPAVSDLSSSVECLKFIALEDLLYMYKKPCVIDVKMGKRQRKIGASLEKEQRQLKKSLETTSYRLGFRVCGSQCYNKKNDTFCYRDKYYGRSLTKEKLFRLLLQWFWNGYVVYFELIAALINSLKVLYSCISELRHYRFWSSSLLWVYDGGLSDNDERIRSFGVKMIDFANTIVLNDTPSEDKEYLFGLKNLILLLEKFLYVIPTSLSVGHGDGYPWRVQHVKLTPISLHHPHHQCIRLLEKLFPQTNDLVEWPREKNRLRQSFFLHLLYLVNGFIPSFTTQKKDFMYHYVYLKAQSTASCSVIVALKYNAQRSISFFCSTASSHALESHLSFSDDIGKLNQCTVSARTGCGYGSMPYGLTQQGMSLWEKPFSGGLNHDVSQETVVSLDQENWISGMSSFLFSSWKNLFGEPHEMKMLNVLALLFFFAPRYRVLPCN